MDIIISNSSGVQDTSETAVDKAILCKVPCNELNEMLSLLYEEKSKGDV